MNDYDVKSNSEVTLLPQDDDGIEAKIDPNNDLFLKCWEQYRLSQKRNWVYALASYSFYGNGGGVFSNILNDDVVEKMNFAGSENIIEFTCMFQYQFKLTSFIQTFKTNNGQKFNGMFQNCYNLETVKIDISSATDIGTMFQNCNKLASIEFVGEGNVSQILGAFHACSKLKKAPYFKTDNTKKLVANSLFYNCYDLEEVPAYDFSSVDSTTNMFTGCTKLKKIHFTGLTVGFDISASTQFEREDLVEILTNLGNASGGSQTLTMGETNLAKLTADDIAIATAKGWTLV